MSRPMLPVRGSPTRSRRRRSPAVERRPNRSSVIVALCTPAAALLLLPALLSSSPFASSFAPTGSVHPAPLSSRRNLLLLPPPPPSAADVSLPPASEGRQRHDERASSLWGWVQTDDGEWEWEEDDPAFVAAAAASAAAAAAAETSNVPSPNSPSSSATPTLPSGSFRPKQSLGQNFLRDGNTVSKIVRAFTVDAAETIKVRSSDGKTMIDGEAPGVRPVELGPGAGALTDPLVRHYGADVLRCIEIDDRSVEMLTERHPTLRVMYEDVLQADYAALSAEEGGPLSVVGNLPYYITSQILFALADASHTGAVRSATVTMQYEVAERIVSKPRCKAYGILSVVFQLYADCSIHFKIPPTVFYPQPKVDSALVGLRFVGPTALRQRLAGVRPADLRRVLTATFQQRRKTVRNGLKKLAVEVCGGDKDEAKALLNSGPMPLPAEIVEARERGDPFALAQDLPEGWAAKRPEEMSPGQFVELTRLVFGRGGQRTEEEGGVNDLVLGRKVWRKLKHGAN